MRILVVDDERAVREALQRALRLEGYEVELTSDGQEALFALARRGVDAIVLDVLMPVMDGLETARKLRRQGNSTPILMLTARHEVSDRVGGLDAGADDYLVKPFALEELLARLRALLRRSAGGDELLSFGDLTLDPGTREVRRRDRPIELTRTEFLLLELFLRNPRLGLRLRAGVELAGGVRRLPAPQDRGRRRAEADSHGARRRVRAP